ncbi:MAG: hypothetical protein AAFU65_03450 [Pseudomonadota bacterium]
MADNDPTQDPQRKKQTVRMALTLAAVAAMIYLAYIGYFVGNALK